MILIILKLFLMQIVAFAIIVLILKKILDRQLENDALRKLELSKPEQWDNISEIVITAHCKIRTGFLKKISVAVRQKTSQKLNIQFNVYRSLWGGVIIKYGNTSIDHSLISRLKEGGFVK